MGVIDRTEDFWQILSALSVKDGGTAVKALHAPVPQAQSELNVWSAELGAQLHQASTQVQELRKLARSKGIFDDKTADVQRLSFTLSQDLQALGGKLQALEHKAKDSGPNRAHAANMVITLKGRLMEVTKDFKDALENRTKAMGEQDARRGLYGRGVAPRERPSGNEGDIEGGSQAVELTYRSSRAEATQGLQRMICQLARMFQDFAATLAEQEQMVQRIDHSVQETLENAEAAQGDLLKYLRSISGNRGLILKVFLILICFAVFFVVFLA
mmetsp:Transcript_5337/g.12507  ORF Transcript_5337/g.12507 Transcript_5337/m.12507 type:complete len:271 (-) Transcript_5337:95-907(-)